MALKSLVNAGGGGGSGGGTIGGLVTGGTAGSVLFVDASGNLGQDNANFNYKTTNTSGLFLASSDSATNTVSNPLVLSHDTSGTVTTGFGTGLLFQGQDSTTANQPMAAINAVWTTATHGSATAEIVFQNTSNGVLSTAAVLGPGGHFGINVTAIQGNHILQANGDNTIDTNATVQFNSNGVSKKPLVLSSFASQTANIFEAQKSDGTLYSGVDSAGNIFASSGQGYYLYNTADQTTNYERLHISTGIASNVFGIRAESGGTGSNRAIAFYSGSGTSNLVTIGASASQPFIVGNFSTATSGTQRSIVGNVSTNNSVSGTGVDLIVNGQFNPTATSTMVGRSVSISPTINYSNATPGAGSYEALRIAVTETALPTGQSYLIRASAGAAGTTDLFSVFNNGQVNIAANNGIALTNQTSDSGAQLATMTNGPTAGNPAFWVRIQVNGTSLAIPAWTAV